LAYECSYSQNITLCGKVTDLDKKPIEFVSIEFTKMQSKKNIYTDKYGLFCFKNLKEDSLKLTVKYLGIKVDTVLLFSEIDSVFLNFEVNTKIIKYRSIVWGINDSIAQIDIIEGRPRLILKGGMVVSKIHGQEIFETNYGIKYYDFGCISLDQESITSYNKVIFKFLDKKYGKKWRKEVRKDVVGL